MTGTAFLFPGLNSIFRDRDRHRFDALHQVQDCFSALGNFGFGNDLQISSAELMSKSRYASIAAITVAIQCGTYRKLLHCGVKPDILAGCSLGDVARSICSGALTLDDTLHALAALRDTLGVLPALGKTVAIRLASAECIDDAVLSRLQSAGFEPSVLSARHMTIGLETKDYDHLLSISKDSGWEISDAEVPYALHSRHLQSTVDALWSQFKLPARPLTTAVFSAVQLKKLDSWEEVYKDGREVFYRPIQWPMTLQLLREKQGVSRFINIGPCNSLILLARETDRSITIESAQRFFATDERTLRSNIA